MYIASYATYVPTPVSAKTTITKENATPVKNSLFSLETTDKKEGKDLKSEIPTLQKQNLFQEKSKEKQHFDTIKKYQDAKSAYTEGSRVYSLAQKPKSAISSLKTDFHLPSEAQKAKENISKIKMVNIYIENDNYYRITAA